MWQKDIPDFLANNSQILHNFTCKQHFLGVYSTLDKLNANLMERTDCFCEGMTANHHSIEAE